MHLEISIGTHFLISYLYNKLPRRSIDLLYENLIKNLSARYKNHWYTKTPLKGTAYRCIKLPVDPIIKLSALESNIILNELVILLPDLTLWIDPGEVAYNLSDDENNIVVIWNSKVNNIEKLLQFGGGKEGYVPLGGNDENEAHPYNSKFIEHNNNKMELLEHLMPQAAPQADPFGGVTLIKQQQQPCLQQQKPAVTVSVAPLSSTSNLMTTAAFAQTKFGSTKLKINNNKKLLRQQMSPVEFSNYIKSKQQQQLIGKLENIWGGRMETPIHCNL